MSNPRRAPLRPHFPGLSRLSSSRRQRHRLSSPRPPFLATVERLEDRTLLAVVINEILFDPPTDLSGDANGDGVREASGDEFIEIVNTGPGTVDISGWTLGDDDTTSGEFAFPAGTVLAENQAAVLFGGGTSSGSFGGAMVFTDDGSISNGLANGGELLELRDGSGALVDSVGYGSAGSVTGGSDQSVTRDPDLTGSFVDHTGATGSGGALFSPGTRIDGSPFSGDVVDNTPPMLTSIVDDRNGGPVNANTFVTYTLTFDEDINAATVDAADFDNAGTAPITVGAITETSPGVFTVAVTPTGVGDLTMRIPAGSVISDTAGNPLAVPVNDDTTIVVDESAEPPMDLFLNELVAAPDGPDSPNEYVEIRGDAGRGLTGMFVIFVESDSGTTLGEVNGATSIVDLTGHAIGTNGFLVILDDAADPYSVAAGTTIVDVPGMDVENASYTVFLVFIDPSTGAAPVAGQDLDAGDDGLDALPAGWAILDGISVLDGGADDRGYAGIVISDNADGLFETGATFVDAGFGGADAINQLMRIGDSTGSTSADWVAFDHDADSSAPDFTIGRSTDATYAAGAIVTNHLGASNPVAAAPTSLTIDNGDAGYTATGFHTIPDAIFPTPEGRDGDIDNSEMGVGTDVATWAFSGLTAGMYRVSATWSIHENRATDAPFSIFDGTATDALLRRTLVNQELAPADFTEDGSAWEDLGVVTITGNALTVQLSDEANQYVIADAVRIEPVSMTPATSVAADIDDGDAGYADTAWNVSPMLEGRLNDVRYQRAGDGSQTAAWTFTGLTPGNYTVAATWSEHANRATNAPFTMRNGTGGELLEIVQVNQELAPDDFMDNGSSWETLSAVTITGDTLVVELSNDANGFVIADGVRIAATMEAPLPPGVIVDDGDADFATTAGWTPTPITEGRGGDVQFAGLGDGTRIATWTFSGLAPGMYRVSATWSASPNRATNAPYTILDGMTSLGTATVNQQLAPADLNTLGSAWEDLLTVQLTGSTLIIELSNAANGFVIADAIRVQPVG